jgi:hypothetical protein
MTRMGVSLCGGVAGCRFDRLREQPPQLPDRLRFSTMLGEIHVDEFRERRRLDQPALASEPLESSFERLSCRLLRLVPAPLHTARAATANAVPIRQRAPAPFDLTSKTCPCCNDTTTSTTQAVGRP